MHHMLTSLSEDDQCIIHFDMTSDDFLALFTEQNINRAEVLGIRLYSGDLSFFSMLVVVCFHEFILL